MPLLFLLLVGLAAGFGLALSACSQLSRNPGPAWRAPAFAAFCVFVALVLVPSALYFYVFHRDWFLLYAVGTDVAAVKAAFLSILLMVTFPLSAFLRAAKWLQRGATKRVRTAMYVAAGMAVIVWPIAWRRLSVVGTTEQFMLSYGLHPFVESAVFRAGVPFSIAIAAAIAMLASRLREREGD